MIQKDKPSGDYLLARKPGVLCVTCQHYQGSADVNPDYFNPDRLELAGPYVHACAAFPVPAGIPEYVLLGQRDHRKPIDGDGGILYQARFPLLFHSLKQWCTYNKWATQVKLPDGVTLYTAWKPVAEQTIEILGPISTKRSQEFQRKLFHKLDKNSRGPLGVLQVIAYDSGRQLEKRADKPYGLNTVKALFNMFVSGRQLYTDRDIHSHNQPRKFKQISLRAIERLLFDEMGFTRIKGPGCPALVQETIQALQPKRKNQQGSFLLRLLGNGIVKKSPDVFRMIARQHGQYGAHHA